MKNKTAGEIWNKDGQVLTPNLATMQKEGECPLLPKDSTRIH